MDFNRLPQFIDKSGRPQDILPVIVIAGDHRDPGQESHTGKFTDDSAGVGQDKLVGDAGQFPVRFGVQVLDVVEHQVDIGQDFFKHVPAGVTGRVQRRGQAGFFT